MSTVHKLVPDGTLSGVEIAVFFYSDPVLPNMGIINIVLINV